MYRAVDFFSWHSGIWTFSPPEEDLAKDTARALDGGYSEYLALSDEERDEKILSLRDLIDLQNQTDEQRARLFVELNWVLDAAQDFDSALSCCEAAIELQPKSDYAWYAKGVALTALGRKEEAIAAYDAALAIKPDQRKVFNKKGAALSALGRNEEAISAYDAALTMKPDDHAIIAAKGVVLYDLGRYEDSLVLFKTALNAQPNYLPSEISIMMMAALKEVGRNEEAIRVADIAMKLNPSDYAVLNTKGMVLSEMGRYKDSATAYDAALKLNPNDSSISYNKACNYALSLQLNDALNFLQKRSP